MKLNEQIDKFKKLTGLLTEAWLNPGWLVALLSRLTVRALPEHVQTAFKELIQSGKITLDSNKRIRAVLFNRFTDDELKLFFRSSEVRAGLEEFLMHSSMDITSPTFKNSLRALKAANPGHKFPQIIEAYEASSGKILKPSVIDDIVKWTPDAIKKWWQDQIVSARISEYWLRYKKLLSNEPDLRSEYMSILRRYEQKLTQGGNYDFTQEQRELTNILSQTTSLRKKFLMELWSQWKNLMPPNVKSHIIEKGHFQDDKFKELVDFFESIEPRTKVLESEKAKYLTRLKALGKMVTPNINATERIIPKFFNRFVRLITTLDARLKSEHLKNIELSDSKGNYILNNIKDRIFSMVFIWPFGYGMLELLQEYIEGGHYGPGIPVGADYEYPSKENPEEFELLGVAKDVVWRYARKKFYTTDVDIKELILANSPIGHAIYGFIKNPTSAKGNEGRSIIDTEYNRRRQAITDSIKKAPLPEEIKIDLLDSIPTLDEMKGAHLDSVQVEY